MPDDIAVSINNVGKTFTVPHEKRETIKTRFIQIFNKKSGAVKYKALKSIDIQIKKGEFFGIVGRNGSGKSTLLKIIAGIYQPTHGKVRVRGLLVPFIELGVGFNPKLTGRENVYLNGAILGFSRKQIDKSYNKIVEFAELEEFMDQRLKNYSSGMQVRLAFACATMAKADVLLVDEVLAVGDASFQRKCFDYFDQLKNEGRTVVFVSHSMDSVREYCDRAVLIEDGSITHEGKANDIANEYNKLFTKDKLPQTSKGGLRWGEGGLSLKDIKMSKDTYSKADKDIVISAEVENATDAPKEFRVGVVIKDSKGSNLTGINTQVMQMPNKAIKPGQTVGFQWKIQNIFKHGNYSVTLAVEAKNNSVYDWWDHAAVFGVESEIRVSYPVQPDIEFKYK